LQKAVPNANHLLGFIKEEKSQVIQPKKRNFKRDGYSKMAQAQNQANYHFDKEKFVQAGMKFVLKSTETEPEQSPSSPPYLVNLLDASETVSWRDVVQV